MSETTSYLLQTLRDRLRDLELDAVAVRSRIEEIREVIQMLEGNPKRRPGRPPRLRPLPSLGDAVTEADLSDADKQRAIWRSTSDENDHQPPPDNAA